MPPSAMIAGRGVDAGAIRAARKGPSAGAPGCERVGRTGDTNSSAAPDPMPAIASRRRCADQLCGPGPGPGPGEGPWLPLRPGVPPPATSTTSRRAVASRSIRRTSARRSAAGVAWCRTTTPLRGGRRRNAGHNALPMRSSVISHRAGYRSGTHGPIARAMPTDSHAALDQVNARIARAAALAGRERGAVTLIAVSKTHPAEAIEPLLAAGQRVFGENRVAEAEAKWPGLREQHPDAELHLIGQLQSNKAVAAVALFDAIHSVDRPSLVTALAQAMERAGRRPACFVQVNIGDEPQKGGCAVADLPALIEAARAAGLPLAGLMALPPADREPAPYFALLAKLAREAGLAGLSMGMSADLDPAVMCGATHVRVGSALFGARGGGAA